MDSVPPDIRALLVHQEFLRALARGLLGRSDLAEDVVQETYLKTLKRPPRHGSSPRGWLAAITRNTALRLRQREAQRPRKEAASRLRAGSATTPTPAEVMEREAVRQRVVRAVLALPDSYREVLLLRYYEDLPPRVIAARLSIPTETVRTRTKRALARLRTALEQGDGQDWRTWALTLLPEGGSRGMGAVATTTAGVFAMKKILGVMGTVLILLGVWWLGGRLGFFSDRVGDADGPSDLSAMDGDADAPPDAGPQLEGAGDPHADSDADPTPFGTVHGLVTDGEGRPMAGARIRVGSTQAPRWLAAMWHGPHQTTTDGDGRFRYVPRKRVDRVRASAEGYTSDGDFWRGGSAPVVLVLRRTNAVVEGTLRDTDGAPVPDAVVHVGTPQGNQASNTGRSDAAGRFRIPFVTGSEAYLVAWAPGFLEVAAGVPGFDPEGRARIDLVLRPGSWVEGRVRDARTGAAIAGATIGSYERYGPAPRTDAEGRFRYRATREIHEVTASLDGYESGKARLTHENGIGRAEIALQPLTPHAFHGLVIDADGAPVPNALVLTPDGTQRTVTDAEGRFVHRGWTRFRESVRVLVAHAGEATPGVLADPKPGEALTLQLGRPAPIAGRIRLASGEQATGALLRVEAAGDAGTIAGGLVLEALRLQGPYATASDGTFRLVGLPAGRYQLHAIAGPGQNILPARTTVDVAPGVPVRGVELQVPVGLVLHGKVVDTEGRDVPNADLSIYGPEPHRPAVTADASGHFRIAGLAGERVTLHVKSPGYRLWHGAFTVTGEPITITLRRSVRLRFVLKGEVSPSGSSAMVWFREPGVGGWSGSGSHVVAGAVVHDLIHDARSYEYVLKGDGWETKAVRVDPVAGTWTLDVPVEVVAAAPVRPTDMVQSRPQPRDGEGTPAAGTTASSTETGTILGRVLGDPGQFRGTTVVARGSSRKKLMRIGDSTHEVDDTPRAYATVEPDGRFRLERVPVGSWTLYCQRGGRHENEVEVTVEANATLEVQTLRAPERGASIRGVVRSADGRPVAGIEVHAHGVDRGTRPGRARSAPDGTFVIEDLEEGDYELRARGERGQSEPVRVPAGRRGVELRFMEYGLIRGTLSGPWGAEDLPHGNVHILGRPPAQPSTSAPLQRNGAVFYFERRLPPGEYKLRARVGPYVTAAETTVTVRTGVIAPSLDLPMVRGATVSLVLVDADGTIQRKGGWVEVPAAWSMGHPKPADDEGVRRFESVPPGAWTLKASGRAGKGETVIEVVAGDVLRAELVLRK